MSISPDQAAPDLSAERAKDTRGCALKYLLGESSDAAANEIEGWLRDAAQMPVGRSHRSLTLAAESAQEPVHADLQRLREQHWVLTLETLQSDQSGTVAVVANAYTDSLTGLANRAFFEVTLAGVLDRRRSGEAIESTILFLDLDRFKAVNDTLGHGAGDALLKLVALRLNGGLGPDDVTARFGGDEFAVLLCGADGPGRIPMEVANRLIDLVGRPYLIDGNVVNVGVSIGLASIGDDTAGEELLRKADLALYYGKSTGRNRVHAFEPVMEERAQARRQMEIELRRALPLRQFELHYQPQIEVESRSMIGVEALLRWRHPERGLLLPAAFLETAEEIGMAPALGEWVVRTACKDAQKWPGAVVVAVNTSSVHFESAGFTGCVQRALKASGLPSNRLEVEITEDQLLRDQGDTRTTVEQLRGMGVRIAMGRFGTGVASLSQLVKLPFDKIKIDRVLVENVGVDPKSRAILRAVSALGKSLGMTTLAEGVETHSELQHVRHGGCQTVQGFYYSQAVPAKDLLRFFSTRPTEPVFEPGELYAEL